MAQMKTPGVYIQEKNAFSTSVVEAATAIPAFIGITEKAVNGSESLANKPWKIHLCYRPKQKQDGHGQ